LSPERCTHDRSVWLEGLTLQVRDVEESLRFYQQIPGAVLEHHRPGQFALLRIGQGCIGLLGLGAPGFHLEISTNDLDALHAQVSEAGMEPDGPPEDRHWGERAFFVTDPDGNDIELAAG